MWAKIMLLYGKDETIWQHLLYQIISGGAVGWRIEHQDGANNVTQYMEPTIVLLTWRNKLSYLVIKLFEWCISLALIWSTRLSSGRDRGVNVSIIYAKCPLAFKFAHNWNRGTIKPG